jgi:hypothetical protein
MLAGPSVLSAAGLVWWFIPFSGDVGPGPGFIAVLAWLVAALYGAAILSWWRVDVRTPILIVSAPMLLFGCGGTYFVVLQNGRFDIGAMGLLAFTLPTAIAAAAGLFAGYRDIRSHPREWAASILVPVGLAVAAGAGLQWRDGAAVLFGIAAADLAVPFLIARLEACALGRLLG